MPPLRGDIETNVAELGRERLAHLDCTIQWKAWSGSGIRLRDDAYKKKNKILFRHNSDPI